MITCVHDSSYAASPDFIASTLHFMACIELPVLTFGGYCILFKTPVKMSSVKLLMLNLHFWTTLSDVLLCVLGVPYILWPALAGWGLGVLDSPGFLFYCFITLNAAIAASIIAIYENRFLCLYGWSTRWSRVRRPVLAALYTFIPFIFLPPYFDVPDQEMARQEVLRMLPCLSPFTFNDRPMYVLSLDFRISFWCIVVSTSILGPTAAIFFFLTLYEIFSKTPASRSLKAHNMQKKFAIALSLQSLFLIIVIVVPISIALSTIILSYYSQTVNNVIFIILSFHGTGSTIVMILVHRPYREYTFSKIGMSSAKKVPNNHKISSMS